MIQEGSAKIKNNCQSQCACVCSEPQSGNKKIQQQIFKHSRNSWPLCCCLKDLSEDILFYSSREAEEAAVTFSMLYRSDWLVKRGGCTDTAKRSQILLYQL